MEPEPDVRSQGAVGYQYCTRPCLAHVLPMSCPSHLPRHACVYRIPATHSPAPHPWVHTLRGTQVPRYKAEPEPEPALTQGPMQPAWPACDQSGRNCLCPQLRGSTSPALSCLRLLLEEKLGMLPKLNPTSPLFLVSLVPSWSDRKLESFAWGNEGGHREYSRLFNYPCL